MHEMWPNNTGNVKNVVLDYITTTARAEQCTTDNKRCELTTSASKLSLQSYNQSSTNKVECTYKRPAYLG